MLQSQAEGKSKTPNISIFFVFLKKTSLFLFVLGLGFWLSNFPQGEIFLTLGYFLCVLSQLLACFLVLRAGTTDKIASLTTRFGYIAILTFVWLRLLFFEGSQWFAFAGILLLVLSVLPGYPIPKKRSKAEHNPTKKQFARSRNPAAPCLPQKNRQNPTFPVKTLFFLLVALVGNFISPQQLFDFKYTEDPKMRRLYRQFKQNPTDQKRKQALERYKQEKFLGKRRLK